MRARINPAWADKIKERLNNATKATDPVPFVPEIISWNPGAQWLIKKIAEKGLIPNVENLGAGVKRIGILGQCCPTCGKPL